MKGIVRGLEVLFVSLSKALAIYLNFKYKLVSFLREKL